MFIRRDGGSLREEYTRRIEGLIPPMLSMQRSSWEQGVASQALLECYAFDPSSAPHLLNYIFGLVHDAAVRQGSDGRLSVLLNGDGKSDAGALDPACIGETFFYVLNLPEGHSNRLTVETANRITTSVERMLDYILRDCPRKTVDLPRYTSTEPLLSHRTDAVQIWSDSIYMLSPFLASAAVYYSTRANEKYDPLQLARMSCEQILIAAKVLQSESGVWSHIYDLDTHAFRRQALWGVGNGWVCAGIVRVLRTFAAAVGGHEHTGFAQNLSHTDIREAIAGCHRILTSTLTGCLRHIRDDGLFHDIVDDPTSFVETNLSQQLAYAIYRLLCLHSDMSDEMHSILGLVPLSDDLKKEWFTVAEKMRAATKQKTDQWGFVRNVCGSPRFDSAGTAAEGQAFGVLMEVARTEYLLSISQQQ